jgi:hypothetical protein
MRHFVDKLEVSVVDEQGVDLKWRVSAGYREEVDFSFFPTTTRIFIATAFALYKIEFK